MKRVLSIALVSAVAAGILGASNMVNADTTDTTTNTDTTANTKGSVTFTSGTLNLSNVTTDAKFAGASVQDIYTTGLKGDTADSKMTATVSDFLGAENSAWTLTVAQSGWTKGTDATDAANATDAAKASVKILDANSTLSIGTNKVTTAGVQVADGKEGTFTMPDTDLTLDIAAGANLTTGTYTNILTWTLADPVGQGQN